MKDEVLSINPDRFDAMKSDPYVVRLPDGHVRVTASSIVFPETCPRCGSSPANTNVSLHLSKPNSENSPSIKLPFCKHCGWTLRITQYLFAAFFCSFMFALVPHLKIPIPNWLSKMPSGLVFIAVFLIISSVFNQVFKLFYKPGVEVVVADKDCFELAFDDQMYAEKFVELNS
jgi:hypothetical protein